MELGDRIRLLRTQKNMTLEELGELVGVGKSTVRKWENGMIANMRRDKIAKVAKALDVSPAFLMGWPDNNEKKELPKQFSVSRSEEIILTAYRKAPPAIQQAVRKLLDIEEEESLTNALNA